MRTDVIVVAAIAVNVLAGCGSRNAPSGTEAAGADESMRTRVLETGAAVLQGKGPLGKFNVHLDSFHFANGRPDEQYEAHHYCEVVNEDFRQCVLLDGNGADAKLVGIEYVISRRIFEQLPMLERTLWHSHAYEVTSGLLLGPGLPAPAEHQLMKQLVGTYGKTWHTWHTERDIALPTGIPTLMAGFTADDQIEPRRVQDRDRRFGVDTADRRMARSDIKAPGVLPGADAWQFGQPMQLMLHPIAAARPVLRERGPDDDQGTQAPRPRSPESRRRDAFAGLDLAHEH
jgi:hypothetical protein